MPLYEYHCKKCNNTFEELLRLQEADKPLTEPCPNCKEFGSVERKIGNVINIWKVDSGTASSKFNKS